MAAHQCVTVLFVAILWSLAWARPALAQEPLTLFQAVDAVLSANPAVAAGRASTQAAEQQLPQARAAYLPRVDFTQSWQRGTHPVFVFGSLLGQRQFSEADFAVRQLNDPQPVTNLRSALALEQVIFDGGHAAAAVRGASLAASIERAAERLTRNDLALTTTRAYGQVLRAAAERRSAQSAVAAAEEDVRTAEARRDAGTGTDADVLSMRVHLAQMRARAIDADSGERIARVELNRLMAAPLDREWALVEPVTAGGADEDTSALIAGAIRQRPEIEQAVLRRDLGRALQRTAQSDLLPNVVAQAGYEWNDGRRASPAGAWIAGASLRVNLFSGGANLARVRAASFAIARADAEQQQVEASVRVDVMTAVERLRAARAREDVGRAAVMQARESHRMIRDRYEAGIVPSADVIRAATAVLDAEAQNISALVDVIVGAAALRRAAGQEVHP
jgi:outer membrane protein TolC